MALHTEREPRRPLSLADPGPLPLRVPRLSVRLRHGVAALLGPSRVLLVQQPAGPLQRPVGLRTCQCTLFRPPVRQPRLPPGYRHSVVCALRTRSRGEGLVSEAEMSNLLSFTYYIRLDNKLLLTLLSGFLWWF